MDSRTIRKNFLVKRFSCDWGLAFWKVITQFLGAMKNTTSKLITLLGALAVLVSFSAPALRAEDAPKKKGPSAKQLEMWDKNKDGKLDEAESAAMKAANDAKKKAKEEGMKKDGEKK
jgi:hypothetical protein